MNLLNFQTKWPEQSEELLGLIVNSLRALDGAVPQGCPEPRRRPQSASKIALVLDRAPKHLQPDLVALVPKLVEQSEHPLAAFALLERLQKPDAEPALRTPVRSCMSFISLFTYFFLRCHSFLFSCDSRVLIGETTCICVIRLHYLFACFTSSQILDTLHIFS